jgi:hypothetical protein
MIKEPQAVSRKQAFLLCRYVQILATGSLAFVEISKDSSVIWVAIIVLIALMSNVVLSQASPFSFFDPRMQAPVLVSDTMMISFALMLSRATQESFFFFFFVLIMAAKVESLAMVGLGAAAIGLASFLMTATGDTWASPMLMRIPFMFAAGVFFAYVVLPERTGEMFEFGRGPRFGSLSVKRFDIREV